MRRRLCIAGTAGILAMLALALTPMVTPASADTGYADAALGIRFSAPSGLYYVAARPAPNGGEFLTTTARLSTYPTTVPQRPADLRNELLVEFTLVRRTATDLRDIATRRLAYSGQLRLEPLTVAGRPALKTSGAFQNGPRTIVLVAVDQQRVLVIQAFPNVSARHAPILGSVLGSLAWAGQ